MADLEKIEEKIEKGETLTPEEKAEVMSAPNVDGEVTPAADQELEKDGKTAKPDSKIAEDQGDEATPDKKKPADEVDTEKLLGDLELPEDEVDMTGYTPREKGLFKALREERGKAQEAQRKADQLSFEKAQADYKRKKEAAEKEKAEADSILEGLDDDDFLTAGQAKKILNLVKKNSGESISEKEEPGIPDEPPTKVELENYALKAFMADSEQESFALASQNMESLLMNDVEAQATIAKARREGKNPVEVAVKLVRQHPKWAQIKAKALPAKAPQKDEKQERLKRLQENENKPKQLGAGGGGADASGDEYTLEEYANMDSEELARLPRSKRKAILEKFGA